MQGGLSSLRTRTLATILAPVAVADLLAVWLVNDRLLAASSMEAGYALAGAQQALIAGSTGILIAAALGSWLLLRQVTEPADLPAVAPSSVAPIATPPDAPPSGHDDEIGRLANAVDSLQARLVETTDALQHQSTVLDTLLKHAGDGILLVNTQGETLIANDRWRELLGEDGGIEAGADLVKLGNPDGQTSFPEAMDDYLASPTRATVQHFERIARSPNDSRQFRCSTAPVRHLEGHALGHLVMLRDVTRESDAERMQSALVANVSHELRSPLTSIKGYVETLLHGGPWEPDTEHEFLVIIAGSADKLSALVDNLLDAARADAGLLKLEREPLRVDRIAEELVAEHRPLAPRHELVFEAEDSLPFAYADPLCTQQVLSNLLENAIKYAPDGGPITVRVCGDEMLVTSVCDHGIGIGPDHLEHLFERFYRADTVETSMMPGLGLGLHISKCLVEAHGGRIWAESDGPGQGSTFSFTLPILDEQATDLVSEEATNSSRRAAEAAA